MLGDGRRKRLPHHGGATIADACLTFAAGAELVELLFAEIVEFGELLFVEDGLQFFLRLIVEGVEFLAEILVGGFLFGVLAAEFLGLSGGIGEDGSECGFLFGGEFQFLLEVRHAAVEDALGDALAACGLRL